MSKKKKIYNEAPEGYRYLRTLEGNEQGLLKQYQRQEHTNQVKILSLGEYGYDAFEIFIYEKE